MALGTHDEALIAELASAAPEELAEAMDSAVKRWDGTDESGELARFLTSLGATCTTPQMQQRADRVVRGRRVWTTP